MTKEQISFEKRILTVGFIAMTLILLFAKFANAQKQGRIWSGSFPPTTPPSGFTTNADFWLDTVSAKTYQWNWAWRLSPVQIVGKDGLKGDRGEQGLPGAPGVCPDCPPASGGGNSSSFVKAEGTLRKVGTEQEFKDAISGWRNGSVNKIIFYQDIGLTSTAFIPKNSTNRSNRLIIDLAGNALFDASTSGLTTLLGREEATSLTDALSMVSHAIIIRDGALVGRTGTGTLLSSGPTYGAIVEGVEFINANEGLHTRFGLMTMVQSCMATNVGESFIFDIDDFPGATAANSQSNSSMRLLCRDFGRAGGKASFSDYGCSGIYNLNCISEGGNKQYGWFVDSKGSTVVKDGHIVSSHLEMQPTIAGISLRLSDGYYNVDGLFSQYPATLVDAVSTGGYPHVYVKNVPWHISGGHKYKTTGSNVIWSFEEIHPSVDVTSTAGWVNANKPFYWSLKGFNQSPFWRGNNISINGQATGTASRVVPPDPAEWEIKLEAMEMGWDIVVYKKGSEHKRSSYADYKTAYDNYSKVNYNDLK